MPPRASPRDVIEHLFKVETKVPVNGQRIVPFKLNATQQYLDRKAQVHKMHLILKARQLGCSSYIEARFLAKCMTVEGTHAAVVSHEKQATMRLLRRVHFFINNMERSDEIVPREYENKYELTFPRTNSSFYLGTAGARAFTRGDMITDFHGSEVAFWPDAGQLMTGVMGALTSEAEVFLETTANGMGGYFYDMYKDTLEAIKVGRQDHPWMFHFFPWMQAEEYSRPLSGRPMAWSPEELWIKDKLKLTWEQLNWRRWKVNQYKSTEAFYQEFPATPDEAFIISGTCYFDKTSLRLYQRGCRPANALGTVEIIGEEARFLRNDQGNVQVWEFPRVGTEYLITADLSEGVEADESESTHLQVINRERFAQVACANGKIPPDDAAVMLYALGKFYRWPWIAVEDNGPGLACLLKLKELGYPRIYKHRRLDLDSQKEVDKIGWHTDLRTRPLMLSELRAAVRRQDYTIVDEELIKECTTFCKQRDGAWKHNSGCKDDRVISNAIVVYLNKIIPMTPDDDFIESQRRGRRQEPEEQIVRSIKTGY